MLTGPPYVKSPGTGFLPLGAYRLEAAFCGARGRVRPASHKFRYSVGAVSVGKKEPTSGFYFTLGFVI